MQISRRHAQTAGALLLLLAAVSVVWWTWSRDPGTPAATQAVRRSQAAAAGKFRVDRGGDLSARQRSNRTAAGRSAEAELRTLVAAADLHAVHERLASLAEAGQLGGVEHLLRDWSREGSLELAQWSLFFSQQSDPGLHLDLCAEALSNPADAIREHAAAELEAVSGVRFTDSARASAWLASRPSR